MRKTVLIVKFIVAAVAVAVAASTFLPHSYRQELYEPMSVEVLNEAAASPDITFTAEMYGLHRSVVSCWPRWRCPCGYRDIDGARCIVREETAPLTAEEVLRHQHYSTIESRKRFGQPEPEEHHSDVPAEGKWHLVSHEAYRIVEVDRRPPRPSR